MLSLGLSLAVAVVVATAVVGVAAHELSHVVALRLAGIPCTVSILPDRSDGRGFQALIQGSLARVTPTRLPEEPAPWRIRVAAMTPLCLALPVALVPLGVLPDPFATGEPALELATVVWLGCAVPSPRDFSLLWYPRRAIATTLASGTAGE